MIQTFLARFLPLRRFVQRPFTEFGSLALVLFALMLHLNPKGAMAVSANFSGHFRTEGSLTNQAGLGAPGTNSTKSYMSGRAMLLPKFVIDDHFTLNTQWSLLTSPALTPDARVGLGVGQGGFIYGDSNTTTLALARAWLEWVSDIGVVRVGRMPISWGYGLVWDAGDDIWNDYQTTLDRLEYQLHFGHIVGALAYSKAHKLSVLGNANDGDFYTAYLKYDNPEQDIDMGILFERQVRSNGQAGDLTSGYANPYHIACGHPGPQTNGQPGPCLDNLPPLASQAPYALSNTVLDIYVKKKIDYLTIGGEGAWVNGSGVNPNTSTNNINAFGVMLNATFEYHKIKSFIDLLYASGDPNTNPGNFGGFVLLHRNRSPGLILGRDLLGNYNSNNIALGSLVYYGNNNNFSGAYYARPGFRVDWSQNWASGIEVIVAQKAAVNSGESSLLGVEVDVGTDHSFYKNYNLGLNVGYLFAGNGLNVPNASGVFGFRAMASVNF